MEGNAFEQKGFQSVILGEGLQGLIGVEVVVHDVLHVRGFGPVEERVSHLVGEGFAALAAEDEEEGGELAALFKEVEGVIQLVGEGLGSHFAFHAPLFAQDDLVRHLLLEGGVALENVVACLEPFAVGLVLVHFYARRLGHNEFIRDGVENAVGQGHNAVLCLNEVDGDLLEFAEPSGEGLGLLEGGAEENELDLRGRQNHGLLPDLASGGVVDVVAFVKDDGTEVVEGQGGCETDGLCLRAPLLEEVEEDFGGHDHDLRIRGVLDIARHNTDGGAREIPFQVVELLITEGLDGGRVEDAFLLLERLVDAEKADQSLA